MTGSDWQAKLRAATADLEQRNLELRRRVKEQEKLARKRLKVEASKEKDSEARELLLKASSGEISLAEFRDSDIFKERLAQNEEEFKKNFADNADMPMDEVRAIAAEYDAEITQEHEDILAREAHPEDSTGPIIVDRKPAADDADDSDDNHGDDQPPRESLPWQPRY